MRLIRNLLLLLAAITGSVQAAAGPLNIRLRALQLGQAVTSPPSSDAAFLGFNLTPYDYYGGYSIFSNAAITQTMPQCACDPEQPLPQSAIADNGTVTFPEPYDKGVNIWHRPGHYIIRTQGTSLASYKEGWATWTDDGIVNGYHQYEGDIEASQATPGVGGITRIRFSAGNLSFLDIRENTRPTNEVFIPAYVTAISEYGGGFRTMDQTNVNVNPSTRITAANRSKPGVGIFKYGSIPYEYQIDLAKAANVPIWINIFPMADQTYVDGLITYANANMPAGLPIKVEVGNEMLNSGFAFWSYAKTAYYTEMGGTDTGNENDNVLRAQVLRHNTIMGYLEAKAAALGASVGQNGRFQRVLGEIDSYANERQLPNASVMHSHTDYVAKAPYFGTGVALYPTPSTDKDVILDRLGGLRDFERPVDLESKLIDALFVKNLATTDGHKFIIYEYNKEKILDSSAEDAVINDARMGQYIGYGLKQIKRMLGNDTLVMLYNDFAFSPYSFRTNYQTGTTSVRWEAYLNARQGIYPNIPLVIPNNPITATDGSIFSFTPITRFGVGPGDTITYSYTPSGAQRGITLTSTTTGILNGSITGGGAGTVTGTLRATGSDGGFYDKAISIPVQAGRVYEFDDDARLVGSTAQNLSARGWTTAGAYYAQNGAIRYTSGGSYGNLATKNLGSGKTRSLLIQLPATTQFYQTSGEIPFCFFLPASGNNLCVKFYSANGTGAGAQLLKNGGYIDNLPLPYNGNAHTFELELAPKAGDASTLVITGKYDGNNWFTKEVPDEYDTTAPVGFTDYNISGSKPIVERFAATVQ